MTELSIEKEWEARIADYKTTKLSDREWCMQHGATKHQLWHWRCRLRKKTEAPQWTAVQITPEDIPDSSKYITIRIGPAQIEVRPGFDRKLLSEVLQLVSASC